MNWAEREIDRQYRTLDLQLKVIEARLRLARTDELRDRLVADGEELVRAFEREVFKLRPA